MTFTLWFVLVGLLLIGMALGGSVLRRLPVTTSILYLAVGVGLGPHGVGLLALDPLDAPDLLHRLAEVAVIVSLFTAGLKLRLEWRDPAWHLPARLALLSMVLTVGMVASVGALALGLSAGAAILLGAVLAPTDPVLASEVEVDSPQDRDRLRTGLTGEAGLNDGTAFPFVMLGLGLLGLHELGPYGWRWVAVDLVWAVAVGLAVGALLGTAVGKLVVYLRSTHTEATGLDEFLTLGLIALAYGTALLLHGYGFLAVFAAGLALRRVEHRATPGDLDRALDDLARGGEETATRAETAPLHMAQEILGFNERLGRIGELALVVLVGSLLTTTGVSLRVVAVIAVLVLVIRPLAVLLGLLGSGAAPVERRLVAWFGIRGIGSVYYLMYAVDHGLPDETAATLLAVTMTTVAVSVVAHGVSVTPLMAWYEHRGRARQPARS